MNITILLNQPIEYDEISTYCSDADLSFMKVYDNNINVNTKFVNMKNYEQVINEIENNNVIVNLCDGNDEEGIPGLCVVKKLENDKRIFTGCSSLNYLWTKGRIKEYNVSTPKYILINGVEDINIKNFEILRFPIIIKPNTNTGGSSGIFKDSVVQNITDLDMNKIKTLLEKYKNLMVEEYISGSEVTVLVTQAINPRHNPIVLEPVQCQFAGDTKYKYFELKWKENSVKYVSVENKELQSKIMEFAKDTYVKLKLDSYVRFDIRIDQNNNLYIIDVNPYPAIFYSPINYGCADFILKYSSIMNHTQFLLHNIECAKLRYN